MAVRPVSTRAIGRGAIREELARVAFPLFCRDGFDNVTFDSLATEAGVSRSTFLRYFGSKEDVVLFVFDPIGDAIVDVFAAAESNDLWGRLRRSLDPAIAYLSRDTEEGLALVRLIAGTPALSARFHDKQSNWAMRLVHAAGASAGGHGESDVAQWALVTAAMGCLTVAVTQWLQLDDRFAFPDLLDQAFEALARIGETST